MKTLFVAGNFDNNGGRPSGLATKLASYIECALYNGGYYKELQGLLDSVINYDCVFWFANVPNGLPKVRHVKEINPTALYISSKRNNNEYEFKEVVRRAVDSKSNLLFEFSKRDSVYNIRVLDPLGCVWYDGENAEAAMLAVKQRLETLLNITRIRTHQIAPVSEDIGIKDFVQAINHYEDVFHSLLCENPEHSFRCAKGMPSFRHKDGFYVSPRKISGYITERDFIKITCKDALYYHGDKKPSVDTPVHAKLYEELRNINYIIHSHCYIENALFTSRALPCGALEEAYEILNVIEDKNRHFYAINELGHGSILMASDVDLLKAVYYSRPIPEKPYKEGAI